jgi:plastocyanin
VLIRPIIRPIVRWMTFSFVIGLTFTSACGKSSTPTPPSPSPLGPGIDATINIKGNLGNQSYSPNPLMLRVGQTVNWHNLDNIEHTATLDGVYDSGHIPPGSAHDIPLTMRTAGTFTYHCTIHPGMVGTIVVQ